jgi:hypothetical protein
MFKLTTPCTNCPFRKGIGETFKLEKDRLEEIFQAAAFQCHKTVDYDHFNDPIGRQGDKPQQCAGLMSLLYKAGKPNQIMQVAQRLGYFDPDKLDHEASYSTLKECLKAHKD